MFIHLCVHSTRIVECLLTGVWVQCELFSWVQSQWARQHGHQQELLRWRLLELYQRDNRAWWACEQHWCSL
jgi:hypothetical protein